MFRLAGRRSLNLVLNARRVIRAPTRRGVATASVATEEPLWQTARASYNQPFKRGVEREPLSIKVNDVVHGFKCMTVTPCPELNLTQVRMPSLGWIYFTFHSTQSNRQVPPFLYAVRVQA